MGEKNYFRIMDDNLIHKGFQYKVGLNTDINPLGDTTGLYFSDQDNILKFNGFGSKIAKVSLPENEPFIYDGHSRYHTHRLIVEEIRELWCYATFAWLVGLGVDIHAENELLLIWSIKHGHYECVRFLIEHDADVHIRNEEPVMEAAYNKDIRIMKELLSQGADPFTEKGEAYRIAASMDNTGILKLLPVPAKEIRESCLIMAVSGGCLETVKYLVGTYPDEKLERYVPFALIWGRYDVMRYLLDKGADASLVTQEDIFCAEEDGYQDCIKLLKSPVHNFKISEKSH